MSHVGRHINDDKHRELVRLYGPGHVNDLLLQWYQARGATSNDLDDAEREFLSSYVPPIDPATENDMWFELLRAAGFEGAISDMLAQFWRGNVWFDDPSQIVSPPWTDNGDGSYTADGSADGPSNRITQDNELQDIVSQKNYEISFTLSSVTVGSVRVLLLSDTTEVATTANVSVNGAHTETITVADAGNIIIGRIAVEPVTGTLFAGTISNIVVRRVITLEQVESLQTEGSVDITDEALDPITVPIN